MPTLRPAFDAAGAGEDATGAEVCVLSALTVLLFPWLDVAAARPALDVPTPNVVTGTALPNCRILPVSVVLQQFGSLQQKVVSLHLYTYSPPDGFSAMQLRKQLGLFHVTSVQVLRSGRLC
jgi:hypothetical protein